MNKYQHVRAAAQTREHTCHWPGCGRQVKPAHWGCTYHWFKLPKDIQRQIWRAYRAGQEEDMKPSQEYLDAAQAAQLWIQLEGIPREEASKARKDRRKQIREEGGVTERRSDKAPDARAIRQRRVQR